MNRLTKRISVENEEVIFYTKGEYENTTAGEMRSSDVRETMRKLAEYEDLEEQGLLLKLPCKVGSTVYVVEDVYGKGEFEITEYRVECMRTGDNFSMTFDALEHDECLEVTFETMDIGRTVFLSYAEAEQELKRLENEQ